NPPVRYDGGLPTSRCLRFVSNASADSEPRSPARRDVSNHALIDRVFGQFGSGVKPELLHSVLTARCPLARRIGQPEWCPTHRLPSLADTKAASFGLEKSLRRTRRASISRTAK